jgi:hypothetical protein
LKFNQKVGAWAEWSSSGFHPLTAFDRFDPCVLWGYQHLVRVGIWCPEAHWHPDYIYARFRIQFHTNLAQANRTENIWKLVTDLKSWLLRLRPCRCHSCLRPQECPRVHLPCPYRFGSRRANQQFNKIADENKTPSNGFLLRAWRNRAPIFHVN